MNLLIIASILCAKNQIGNLCYSITPDQSNPAAVDMEILDTNTMEYLKTFWSDQTTMISQITDENGCYEWLNEENQTTTCQ